MFSHEEVLITDEKHKQETLRWNCLLEAIKTAEQEIKILELADTYYNYVMNGFIPTPPTPYEPPQC